MNSSRRTLSDSDRRRGRRTREEPPFSMAIRFDLEGGMMTFSSFISRVGFSCVELCSECECARKKNELRRGVGGD